MNHAEELTLLKQAQGGNDEAFAQLFHHHYSFLYKYMIKLCCNPDLAEDLVQDTMLKAYINLRTFKGEAKFSTWLISIASRLYIDHQRAKKREQRRVEKAKDDALRKLKWNVTVNGYEWTEYLDQFAQLDVKVRAPLLLRHYYGYTYGEIAAILNIKEGTVKTRIHNGLKKIRKEWSW